MPHGYRPDDADMSGVGALACALEADFSGVGALEADAPSDAAEVVAAKPRRSKKMKFSLLPEGE